MKGNLMLLTVTHVEVGFLFTMAAALLDIVI
jgi:hypothetical protein